MHCVQNEQEATGRGFKAVKLAVQRHCPALVAMECVTQLAAKGGEETSISDAEYMVKSLRELGYWAHTDTMQATDYGSPVTRERQWWAGILNIRSSNDEVAHFFNTILTGLKTFAESNIEDFLTFDDDDRRAEGRALGLPIHQDLGPRQSKSTKENLQWKSEHKVLCDDNNMVWPIPEAQADDVLDRSGLFPREADMLCILHSLWPPAAGDRIEYIDANAALGRLVMSHVDEATGQPKGTGSPWRASVPTLTGSIKLAIRRTVSGKSRIRLAESFESLRLIGWSDDCWAHGDVWKAHGASREEACDLLSNLAGNAFSAYQYGPWLAALLVTMGRYGGLSGSEMMEPPEELSPSQDEGNCESCSDVPSSS